MEPIRARENGRQSFKVNSNKNVIMFQKYSITRLGKACLDALTDPLFKESIILKFLDIDFGKFNGFTSYFFP